MVSRNRKHLRAQHILELSNFQWNERYECHVAHIGDYTLCVSAGLFAKKKTTPETRAFAARVLAKMAGLVSKYTKV